MKRHFFWAYVLYCKVLGSASKVLGSTTAMAAQPNLNTQQRRLEGAVSIPTMFNIDGNREWSPVSCVVHSGPVCEWCNRKFQGNEVAIICDECDDTYHLHSAPNELACIDPPIGRLMPGASVFMYFVPSKRASVPEHR